MVEEERECVKEGEREREREMYGMYAIRERSGKSISDRGCVCGKVVGVEQMRQSSSSRLLA